LADLVTEEGNVEGVDISQVMGFMVTTRHATHFISGDIFLSAALLCLVDSALGIYLAWWLLHPR
jgi:hypothetical protein